MLLCSMCRQLTDFEEIVIIRPNY